MRKCLIVGLLLLLTGCSETTDFIEPEFIPLETIDVSSNIINDYNIYEDVGHEEYEYKREPDIDLPDISGFDKDEYGNYILTEEALNGDKLPLNNNGQIDYVFYYDVNGNVVNPMPEYYEDYPEYFMSSGG